MVSITIWIIKRKLIVTEYFILKENLLSNLYYDSEVKVAFKVDDSGISLDSIKLFDSRSEYCIYFGKIFDNLI